MILEQSFTLSNGVRIPKIGYGTWMIPDGDAARAVSEAIATGYRHIDTAQAYGNERGVGEGVRHSGVSRDQIFVTSKLAAESKATPTRRSASTGRCRRWGSIASISC